MNLREIFSLIWKVGIAIAIIIYATRFNDLSETEMVQLSYLWLPFIVFGLAGIYGLRNIKNVKEEGKPPRAITVIVFALIIAVVAVGLLMFFYETIWPEL